MTHPTYTKEFVNTMILYMCVCAGERERETDRQTDREGERDANLLLRYAEVFAIVSFALVCGAYIT